MKKRPFLTILVILFIICAARILIKLISGTFKLFSGAADLILSITVIILLLAIIAFMFLYARKKK